MRKPHDTLGRSPIAPDDETLKKRLAEVCESAIADLHTLKVQRQARGFVLLEWDGALPDRAALEGVIRLLRCTRAKASFPE